MTLPYRHRIRNSSSGGVRPSTLPLGHRDSPQYWIFTSDRGKNILFLWNSNARAGFETRELRLLNHCARKLPPLVECLTNIADSMRQTLGSRLVFDRYRPGSVFFTEYIIIKARQNNDNSFPIQSTRRNQVVRSIFHRKVACSTADQKGSNVEFRVQRAISSWWVDNNKQL